MRSPLPARRPCLTVTRDWRGHSVTLSIGLDPATGRVAEVFADAGRGGELAATLADAAVLVSLCLQHGIAPAALARSIGREPDVARGAGATLAASPVGLILDVVQEVQG